MTSHSREFTSTDGKKINAEIVTATEDEVVLKMGAREFRIPIARLSEPDRKHISEWRTTALKNKIPKLKVEIYSGKSDRRDKNDSYDDRTGSFQFKVKITNEEIHYQLSDATAKLVVIGEDCDNSKVYGVMQTNSFKVSAEPGKTFEWQGKPFHFEYDDDPPTHGVKYYGYVLQLKNSSGKVIYENAIPKKFEDSINKILPLKYSAGFDKDIRSRDGFYIYKR